METVSAHGLQMAGEWRRLSVQPPMRVAGGNEMTMKVLFDNAEYDGQLLRALGAVYYGGADVGECLTTARRIAEGDDDGWYREWCATADRLFAAADASHAAGHLVSAREGYLR